MINLLPYDIKRQTKAARVNIILVRYIFILGISAGFLVIACLVTYFFINNSSLFVKPAVANTSSSNIQAEATSMKTDFATAKSILDQQVPYSKVITAIANVLPAGTKLDSLSINDGSFGATINLSVSALTSESETTLKTSLSSSQYFSGYRLISTTSNPDLTSKYQFVFNISIIINKVAAS
jgi:Tfp pilus assembly protein PilN